MFKRFFHALLILSMLGSLLFCSGCGSSAPQVQTQSYYTYFDTVSFVYSYQGDSQEEFQANCAIVDQVLDEYHRLLDIYYEYSGINNLCTLNQNAGGEALAIAPELTEFLLYCKQMYSLTNGIMNPMLGSVLQLWHQARSLAEEDPSLAYVPDTELLQAASEHCSIDLLEIDQENNTARITDPLASIDVGALGKGYATEKAAQALLEKGIAGYVLNIGGNIRCLGTKPSGEGWTTGIKDPFAPENNYACSLTVQNASCVTSGIYERYFTVDGQKYHHIVDPATLQPANYFASLSVITENSALADTLSTALFCMDYESGRSLVDSLPEVEAIWIFNDGQIQSTLEININA